MVKKRIVDSSQDFHNNMPVKDTTVVKEEDVGDRRTKERSYNSQPSYWGRELRNRFIINSNERNRTDGECSIRSRYGNQDEQHVSHQKSSRIPVSLNQRRRIYNKGDLMEDSDDIGLYEQDEDNMFSCGTKRSARIQNRLATYRSLRRRSCVQRQSSRRCNDNRLRSSRRLNIHRAETEDDADDDDDDNDEDDRVVNGHDGKAEKPRKNKQIDEEEEEEEEEGEEGVRRSKRQRKLLYDNFNTSWILGTQKLPGYPMFDPDKEGVKTEEQSEHHDGDDDDDDEGGKVTRKKRQPLSDLPSVVDDGYEDMYSRVKRPRRPNQRYIFKEEKRKTRSNVSEDEGSDTQSSRSSSEVSGRNRSGPQEKYHLRKKKPAVDRFQVKIEPQRRSSRILRSVLYGSVRKRRRCQAQESSSTSSDDENFERQKGKSRSRCKPLKFASNEVSVNNHPRKTEKLADVNPMSLDTSIRFEHVGGLEEHIRCLKEMVVFPMLYREVFDRFHIQPSKGILFHGPPGTGKTLMARALANECSQGQQKVSFFMRKGADILSKWVGESERQLRLLFEQAYQMRPSIIFFDEIDGLAPVRSSKQDQIHASIVSTLLALMDGIDNRGEIIIIGATNRIDAIDPALRRPGRFDRELYFPLPASKERQEILHIHVDKWEQKPAPSLLMKLADDAVGYCGSDLRALCSEAVIQSLRRMFPQIYSSSQKLFFDANSVKVEKVDFFRARNTIIPAAHRVLQCPGRKLSILIKPLLKTALDTAVQRIRDIFPPGVARSTASILPGAISPVHRPRLLVAGTSSAQGQTAYLGPALLHHMEHVPVHTLDLATLYEVSGRSPEEACIQVFNEARRNFPSIVYVPAVNQWWTLAGDTLQALFISHLGKLNPSAPILLLATTDVPYEKLPFEIQQLFSEYRGEVFQMENPNAEMREAFFSSLFKGDCVRPVRVPKKVEPLPELPLAPAPPPRKLTEKEQEQLYNEEEAKLRELRIFLREICWKLARNRQFYMFTKPVDIEEVPDYLTIIKEPMDLETMMRKIDSHHYACAEEFLNDIDLLCRNALEYNPDRDPADKLIRHRACSLRDTAYALIKAEMDSDFEDQCKDIARARKQRAESPSRFAPEFVHTINSINSENSHSKANNSDEVESQTPINQNQSTTSSIVTRSADLSNKAGSAKQTWKFTNEPSMPKKRRSSVWARGCLTKRKKYGSAQKTVKHDSSSSSQVDLELADSVLLQSASGNITQSAVVNGIHKKNTPPESTSGNSAKSLLTSTPKSSRNPSPNDAADDQNDLKGEESASQDDQDSIFSDNAQKFGQTKQTDNKVVVIDSKKLQHLLNKTVEITENCPVDMLVELHVQLKKCVVRRNKVWDRTSLPEELDKELERFQGYCSSSAAR